MIRKIFLIVLLACCSFQQLATAHVVNVDSLNKEKYLVYEGSYTDDLGVTTDFLPSDYWVVVKQLAAFDFDKNKILSAEQHKAKDLDSYKLVQYEKELKKILDDVYEYNYTRDKRFLKVYLFAKHFQNDLAVKCLNALNIPPIETPENNFSCARVLNMEERSILYDHRKEIGRVLKEADKIIEEIKANNDFLDAAYFVNVELEDKIGSYRKSDYEIYEDFQRSLEQGYTAYEDYSITKTYNYTSLRIIFNDKNGWVATYSTSPKDDSLWKQVGRNCYEIARERTSQRLAEKEAKAARYTI